VEFRKQTATVSNIGIYQSEEFSHRKIEEEKQTPTPCSDSRKEKYRIERVTGTIWKKKTLRALLYQNLYKFDNNVILFYSK